MAEFSPALYEARRGEGEPL